jgi:gamma-glutamyl-gamma-aminobutyrate hydrolase PuuD
MIEDIKDPGKFIAVQWHPETLQQNKEQKNLFGWLVEEDKKRKAD